MSGGLNTELSPNKDDTSFTDGRLFTGLRDFFEIDPSLLTNTISGINAAAKVWKVGEWYWQQCKLKSFLRALSAMTDEMARSEFDKWSKKRKEYLRAFVISELDKQTSENQAEALAYLVIAFQQSKIDQLSFEGVAHEIKYINPVLFYFETEKIQDTTYVGQNLKVEGSNHLLPRAFIHIDTDQEKGIMTMGETLLNNLGKIFMDHVYKPMAKKHDH